MIDRRPASRWPAGLRRFATLGRGGPPTVGQTAVTVAALVVMVATSFVRTGTSETPSPALLVAIVAAWAPLLLRTSLPAVALVGTLTAESAIMVFLVVPDTLAIQNAGMGAYQPVPLASMVAVGTLASRVPRRIGWQVGAAAGGYLMVLGITQNSSTMYLTDLLVFYLVVTAAAVGVWLSARRERARRAALDRDRETQQAVLDERLRIARELHDVLAHNLTLVNAQAGVAQYLLGTDAPAAGRALADITQHTSRAIDDLRTTIGLLRTPEDGAVDGPAELRPVPGLAEVHDLITTARSTGADVRWTESGSAVPLPQHVDLAAYRVLQEALTNAAKHAAGSTVRLSVRWSTGTLELRATNALPSAPPPSQPGTGHGLIGMRERVTSTGGTFHAGPTPDGRFEVEATLPVHPPVHDDRRPPGPRTTETND